MINEYCIISVDDTRADNKAHIRRCMTMPEARVEFVDGRDPCQLYAAKEKWRDVETPGPFKAGEFGIFYSVLNCLEYGANHNGIVYFEDDALVVDNISSRLDIYLFDLPTDADLFALWSPKNQEHDYKKASGYNSGGEPQYKAGSTNIFDYGHPELCRLWQGYGNVAMAFTKQGCTKLLQYITNRGFFSPVDCLICIASHTDNLTSYALKPTIAPLVNYNWETPTTIHHSAWGSLESLMEV